MARSSLKKIVLFKYNFKADYLKDIIYTRNV